MASVGSHGPCSRFVRRAARRRSVSLDFGHDKADVLLSIKRVLAKLTEPS